MVDHNRRGIGQRYQQETKYTHENIGKGYINRGNKPEPFKQYPDAQIIINLPSAPMKGGMSLWEALYRRRSQRDFTSSPITAKELSQLLFAIQGVTAEQEGYLFRTAPSAGALYPIETYLLINRVESIERGLYHFNIIKNCLELLSSKDMAMKLTVAALGQSMLMQCAVVFIWTAIAARSEWKYADRAFRYIYMDAGHIGQNLYLASVALNLGCCTIGAFFDDKVNEILGVDGIRETTVYMGVVGHIA